MTPEQITKAVDQWVTENSLNISFEVRGKLIDKLIATQLRSNVGRRVKAIGGMYMWNEGVIIDMDGSVTPYLVKFDNGLKYWKRDDCIQFLD